MALSTILPLQWELRHLSPLVSKSAGFSFVESCLYCSGFVNAWILPTQFATNGLNHEPSKLCPCCRTKESNFLSWCQAPGQRLNSARVLQQQSWYADSVQCFSTRPWRQKATANSFTLIEVFGVTICTIRLLGRIYKGVQGHSFHIGCCPWAPENKNVYQCGGFLKPSRSLMPRGSSRVAIFFRKLRFVWSCISRGWLIWNLWGTHNSQGFHGW